jgi:hypothetical protein
MKLSWNRILSGIVVAIYVFTALIAVDGEHAFMIFVAMVFPLACIWFSDTMGGFIGPAGAIGITAPSPGAFVRILGWIVLLLPLLFFIV